MKAIVDVKKEGKWYVATDLVTHVADQGHSREQALSNLMKGLKEHYELLLELAPKRRGTRIMEVEV
jgi:predicted RNase H-like HicB family nuclease